MDELEAQLRRYADAAETRVPSTPDAPRHRRPGPAGRRGRTLLAAAAVVALLGGSFAVFAATRNGWQQVDTTPADDTTTATTTEPIVLPRHQCPEPADQPDLEHLIMALPFVAPSEHSFGSTPAGHDAQTVLIAPGSDRWVEVRVENTAPAADLLDPPAGAATLDVAVCDPFQHDGAAPRAVTAVRSGEGDERSLSFPLGERWTVTVRTGPPESSQVTDELLIELIGGMSWPDPAGDPEDRPGATTTIVQTEALECPDDPDTAIQVGSFTLTMVPDGFEPMLPVEETNSGAVDMGGETTATLTLVRSGGGIIQVSSFGSESPDRYIARFLGGSATDHVNVRRCVRTDEGWQRLDSLALLFANGGATMLAAQEWEYEGYLVTGSQVTTDELVTVAEGLRFVGGVADEGRIQRYPPGDR